MIKKLRAKLVAASMLSLFLVLAVIMGAVNFLPSCLMNPAIFPCASPKAEPLYLWIREKSPQWIRIQPQNLPRQFLQPAVNEAFWGITDMPAAQKERKA